MNKFFDECKFNIFIFICIFKMVYIVFKCLKLIENIFSDYLRRIFFFIKNFENNVF